LESHNASPFTGNFFMTTFTLPSMSRIYRECTVVVVTPFYEDLKFRVHNIHFIDSQLHWASFNVLILLKGVFNKKSIWVSSSSNLISFSCS
jgi:hypothetical protein